MLNKDPRFPGAVLVTLIIAMLLTLIPLGDYWSLWRPEWIALTLVHWALIIQDRLSLSLAFATGLIIDTLYGSILGQHALGFIVVAYVAVRLSFRMSPEAFLQQIALLMVSVGLYMLINLWIQGFTGNRLGGLVYWQPLLSSIVVWPIYHALLGYFYIQRKIL
jgi:rod shape-determining protein MreD